MTLSLDASTPAYATGSADPWTTASFTPPVDSFLVAVVTADWFNGTPTIAVTSTGLEFARIIRAGALENGVVEIWIAEVGSNGGSSRTVSATTTLTDDTGGLKVFVFTSDSDQFYIDSRVGGTSATDNLSVNVPVGETGNWVVGGAVDWTSNGAPTSTDTEESFDDASLSLITARKASTSSAGTETLNFDSAGSPPAWAYACVSVGEGPAPKPWLVSSGAMSAAASGTSITPTIPPGDKANDVMLMQVMCNGSTTFTTPTDWTLLGTSVESNSNQSTEWYWKRHDGSESNPTSTTSATLSTTLGGYGRIHLFRDCKLTGDPFEDVTMNGTPTSSTTPSSAAIDTTGDNELAVCLLSVDDDNAWSSGNPPANWSAFGFGPTTSTTGGDCMMDGIHRDVASATTVAAATVGTMSAADFWRTLTLALLPEPPASGTNAAAENAGVTATSNAPTTKVSPGSQVANVAATANQPTVTVGKNVDAGNANVAATAHDATVKVSTGAGVANVAAAALAPAPSVKASASVADAATVANAPTVSTASSTNAPAGVANVAASANAAGGSVAPNAGAANATTAGLQTTSKVSPTANVANVAATAEAPTVQTGSFVSANAQVANVGATANGAGGRVAFTAEIAAVVVAAAASTSVRTNAALASVTVAGNFARGSIAPSPAAANVTAASPATSPRVLVSAGASSVLVAAGSATMGVPNVIAESSPVADHAPYGWDETVIGGDVASSPDTGDGPAGSTSTVSKP